MSLFRKIFLFLSICFCLAACKTPSKCLVSSEVENFNFKPVIDLASNKPVLYSSEFKVLKYRFSGLIAFRHMIKEDEIRIIFLSETGLKLMEFNYKNGEINNSYCISLADRKQVKKFVKKFLLLLIEKTDCKNICIEKTNEKSVYFCKTQGIKLNTGTIENQRIHSCISTRKSTVYGTYSLSAELPDEIEVTMSHKTRIKLKRVDNAFK